MIIGTQTDTRICYHKYARDASIFSYFSNPQIFQRCMLCIYQNEVLRKMSSQAQCGKVNSPQTAEH